MKIDNFRNIKMYHIGFIEIEELARQGNKDAQFNIGCRYLTGRHIKHDNKKAMKWFRLAAEEGCPDSQYNIGILFENGDGITKNDTEAVKWYRRASKKGHMRARNSFNILLNGDK